MKMEAAMANTTKRVPENVSGDFFVDSTCIDCDACRQIAPSVFGEADETSFVKAQPVSSTERRQALRALLACPTGSIGCLGGEDVKAVMSDFALVIEEPVFYCGYNSPKSYGGNRYWFTARAIEILPFVDCGGLGLPRQASRRRCRIGGGRFR